MTLFNVQWTSIDSDTEGGEFMQSFRVLVPREFYTKLYPFNAELLKGGAFLIRAIGANKCDGSVRRTKGYLLFGNALATVPLYDHAHSIPWIDQKHVMVFTEKIDKRNVAYWEVQAEQWGSETKEPVWHLEVSDTKPDSDNEGHIIPLIEMEGDPGQYFYLARTA